MEWMNAMGEDENVATMGLLGYRGTRNLRRFATRLWVSLPVVLNICEQG
jgi:hypothetical protein